MRKTDKSAKLNKPPKAKVEGGGIGTSYNAPVALRCVAYAQRTFHAIEPNRCYLQ